LGVPGSGPANRDQILLLVVVLLILVPVLVVVLVLGKLSSPTYPVFACGHNREKDSNSQNEETSHEAHLLKTGGRQSRWNEADTQTRSS